MARLCVGDRVRRGDIVRQITEVRETGYSWVYPEIPEKNFLSENSCDPFFELWGIQ